MVRSGAEPPRENMSVAEPLCEETNLVHAATAEEIISAQAERLSTLGYANNS